MKYPEFIFTESRFHRIRIAFRYREIGSMEIIAKEEGITKSRAKDLVMRGERTIEVFQINTLEEVRHACFGDGPSRVLNHLGTMERDHVAKLLPTMKPEFMQNYGVGPVGLKAVFDWAGVRQPRWLTELKTPKQGELDF